MLASAEHPEKAPSPIDLIPSLRVTEESFTQTEKVSGGITVPLEATNTSREGFAIALAASAGTEA